MIKRGFTLVEILVAMTILFLVITTGFMAYQQVIQQNARAAAIMHIFTMQPFIKHQVQHSIRSHVLAGEAVFSEISYQWQAIILKQEAVTNTANDSALSPTSFTQSDPERTFFLYRIELTLAYNGVSRVWEYQELAW